MFDNEQRPFDDPLTPVPVAPVRTGRRVGVRWVVGLLVVALVGTVVIAGSRLLTPPATATDLASWAPADSLVYVETNLDVPGDQKARLGAFLAHFPGFGVASDLDARLTEAYDRIVRGATGEGHDYRTEIEPWFAGSVAGAVTRLPAFGTADPGAGGALLLAGVRDRAAARAWIDMLFAESETKHDKTTSANAELWETPKASLALLPNVLLVGDTASVRASIERNGIGGLASVAAFTASAKAADADNLLFYYLDSGRYMDQLLEMAGGSRLSLSACATGLAAMPAWMAGTVRADDNAIVSRAAWPHFTKGTAVTSNAKSALPAHVPASTLAIIDYHEAGSVVRAAIDQFRTCSDPNIAAMFKQIDTAVGAIGGWDALTGPFGETALVFDRDGQTPTGGLIFVPTDRAAAERLADQAVSLVTMAGSGLTATEETYAGAALTILAGSSVEVGASTLRLAIVVTDSVAAVGLESWVKRVLDTQPAQSLAGDARFSAALAKVDAEHASLIYANVAGILELVDAMLPTSTSTQYQGDVRPYLAALDAIIVTSTVASDLDRLNAALTVR